MRTRNRREREPAVFQPPPGGFCFSENQTPRSLRSRPPYQGGSKGRAMSDYRQLLGKEEFAGRHIGPDTSAQRKMLQALGVPSLDALIGEVVPQSIRLASPL